MVLLHGWLLLLTLSVLAMAVACLKYCATNRVKYAGVPSLVMMMVMTMMMMMMIIIKMSPASNTVQLIG